MHFRERGGGWLNVRERMRRMTAFPEGMNRWRRWRTLAPPALVYVVLLAKIAV